MKKLVLIPFHKYQALQSQENIKDQVISEVPEESNLQLEKSSTVPIRQSKLEKDIILCHIGKGKRGKAETLLQYINQSPNLDWNNQGELIVNDKVIPGSHISDLVKDSVTEYKHFEPVGLQQFYQHLGNIPLTIITNPKSRRLLQKGGQSTPPPGKPEKSTVRVLKTVSGGKKKTVKRLKSSWKDMWKTS